MLTRVGEKKDVVAVIELLQQDGLQDPTDAYPEKSWVECQFDEGWVYVLYQQELLLGVVIAEKLLDRGALVWYLAINQEYQGQGLGGKLLTAFELYLKAEHAVEWIHLNSTPNAEHFYLRQGYKTGAYSYVKEYQRIL